MNQNKPPTEWKQNYVYRCRHGHMLKKNSFQDSDLNLLVIFWGNCFRCKFRSTQALSAKLTEWKVCGNWTNEIYQFLFYVKDLNRRSVSHQCLSGTGIYFMKSNSIQLFGPRFRSENDFWVGAFSSHYTIRLATYVKTSSISLPREFVVFMSFLLSI